MTPVIYSMCCRLPGDDGTGFNSHLEMCRLWLASLRGPGEFDGRVVMLTTERALDLPDVETVSIADVPRDRASLFVQRVLLHDRLRPAHGERWMQLDTDTLIRRPMRRLFDAADEHALSAAPSDLSPLHRMMARSLMCRPTRAWYGSVRGWRHRTGVSACLTTCTARRWNGLMGRWAKAIRRHGDRPLPVLGDQSFLNLLYMTGRLAVRPLPTGLVHHVKSEADLHTASAASATVLHFANPQKLAMMRRMGVR